MPPLILPLRADPPGEVERWGVFEFALNGPSDGNPFLDVELAATFAQGDRRVRVDGFYDGNGVYRVRFSPETEGEWRYETTSNIPALHGRAGVVRAIAPKAGNHGPVRVRGFHFSHADGTPYFQLGTTAYAWIHRPDAQVAETLQTLAGSPFNKLRMCVLPPGGSPRFRGVYPFAGQPGAWDFARFNPEFFRHLDDCVRRLGAIGVQADLILFNPFEKLWGFNALPAATDDRLVRYLVARLGAFQNVWWSLCNEWDFHDHKTEADWDRLFGVLAAADPYERLASIHNGYLIYNHAQPWVTHASVQHGTALLDPERAVILRDAWRKPVIYDEARYEGQSARRWGQLSGPEMVLRFWSGLVAGTYVGHSEVLPAEGKDIWLSGGGSMRGESVARLAFFKQVMEAGPREGWEPIDKWQDRRTGGKAGEQYLVYLGANAPHEWPFALYKTALRDGMKFTVEVIDTWAMTIAPVEGVFEIRKRDSYDFAEKNGRNVPLPGKPYQAIRIRALDARPAPATVEREL